MPLYCRHIDRQPFTSGIVEHADRSNSRASIEGEIFDE
jgi:hypothetical protein